MIAPYDENWPFEFERIKRELGSALGDCALAIEHVGSTAVPGLCAKPIIDIDVVTEKCGLASAVKHLREIGYFHVGDLGIAGREAFSYENKPHLMEHHLYVCDRAAEELRRHIALRDFLRCNSEYREKYSQIKIEMAQKHPHSIDDYISGKQPVILEIYRKCGLGR